MPDPIVAALDAGLLAFGITVAVLLFIVGKLVLLVRASPGGREELKKPSHYSEMLRHWRQGKDG